MVTYIMEASRFIEEYKPGGNRDKFYMEKYGRSIDLPTNISTKEDDDGNEIVDKCTELCVSGIKKIKDRNYVTITDEHGCKLMSISQALTKLMLN